MYFHDLTSCLVVFSGEIRAYSQSILPTSNFCQRDCDPEDDLVYLKYPYKSNCLDYLHVHCKLYQIFPDFRSISKILT